jgi:Flp pilus assembly protein TadG
MAATEFAMVLPIMTMVFFGMLETSDAMMANRRLVNAANSLVDLIGQETEISRDQVDDVMIGVQRMLEPNNGSSLVMRVTSVIRDPDNDDRLEVVWSRDSSQGTPYAAGSEFTKLDDGTIVHEGASLIVVEIDYDYTSSLTHKVLGSTFHFKHVVSRWPRQSAQVTLCGSSPLPACTT